MDINNYKKVIYTTITGGYDQIFQPNIIAEDFDYILFTNDIPEQQLGMWKVKAIPYNDKNNIKLSRWVKTHPHTLLPEYDYSLYLDSNIIVDQYKFFDRINELIKNNTQLGIMNHLHRNCIYEEGFEVLYLNLAQVSKVMREMVHIKHQGYPVHNGLVEANCILRSHHDQLVKQFCEDWWYMIDHYAQRDQLSCNFVAWKCGLTIEHILPLGYNTRNHPYIHCVRHNPRHDINRLIWYDPLKEYFKKHAKPYYQRFIAAPNYSFKEFLNFIMVILIRKYYSLIMIKYRLSTRLKSKVQVLDSPTIRNQST